MEHWLQWKAGTFSSNWLPQLKVAAKDVKRACWLGLVAALADSLSLPCHRLFWQATVVACNLSTMALRYQLFFYSSSQHLSTFTWENKAVNINVQSLLDGFFVIMGKKIYNRGYNFNHSIYVQTVPLNVTRPTIYSAFQKASLRPNNLSIKFNFHDVHKMSYRVR